MAKGIVCAGPHNRDSAEHNIQGLRKRYPQQSFCIRVGPDGKYYIWRTDNRIEERKLMPNGQKQPKDYPVAAKVVVRIVLRKAGYRTILRLTVQKGERGHNGELFSHTFRLDNKKSAHAAKSALSLWLIANPNIRLVNADTWEKEPVR